jgi:hypothetical protein
VHLELEQRRRLARERGKRQKELERRVGPSAKDGTVGEGAAFDWCARSRVIVADEKAAVFDVAERVVDGVDDAARAVCVEDRPEGRFCWPGLSSRR